MFTRLETESTAKATKYEKPEEENRVLLQSLGPEVEMTTFKTNVPQQQESDEKSDVLLKIVCVGDYTAGADTKGLLIRDYMRTRPVRLHPGYRPTIGVDFCLHRIKWETDSTHRKRHSILLQFWEIAEQERFRSMTKFYYKGAHGALVFWGPNNPSSLKGALAWKEDIQKKAGCHKIPHILVTDNTRQQQWIGPGKMFDSAEKVDEFCQENDFVTWFELTSRDWDSGEDSVFGQAVHRLIGEILN